MKNDFSKETPIGVPAIYRNFSISPDKNYILTTTIDKPFSYLIPSFGFPHTVAVIDMNGKLVRPLAKNPSAEGQPIGFDDASGFPRGYDWRDDVPATIVYVHALDNGLGKTKSEYRDAFYAVDLQSNAEPKELFKTKRRFGGITWVNQEVY